HLSQRRCQSASACPRRPLRRQRASSGRPDGACRWGLPSRIDSESRRQDCGRISAHHAVVRRHGGRGGNPSVDRVHQVAWTGPNASADGRGGAARRAAPTENPTGEGAMSTAIAETPLEAPQPAAKPVHYLNVDFGVKSWLLTTDHKRIALL